MNSALPLSEYLIQQLMVDVDLNHVDGRAKLKALAAPLFARMPEGVYREMLAESLAARVSMPAAALKKCCCNRRPKGPAREAAHPRSNRNPRPRRRGRISAGRGNLLTQAITLVLHHPTAAAAVRDLAALGAVDRPGIGVLKELLAQAASSSPSTAVLLERWRDLPEYGRLADARHGGAARAQSRSLLQRSCKWP